MSNRLNPIAAVVGLVLPIVSWPAFCATAADAHRIIDRMEPVRCEVTALEARVPELDRSSPQFETLKQELNGKYAEFQRQFQSNWAEYVSVVSSLTAEQRASVERYSAGMERRCNLKICGAVTCPNESRKSTVPTRVPPRPTSKAYFHAPAEGIEQQPPK